MRFTYTILCVFLCIKTSLFSQEIEIKKANKTFENLAYIDAIDKYHNIIKNGKTTIEVYQKLGDAYYFNSNLKSALKWYKRSFERKKELEDEGVEVNDFDKEYYIRYMLCLKYLEQYEEAHEFGKNIKEADSRITKYKNNPDYLNDIEFQSGRFTITNFDKNSAFTDFAPTLYKDQLIFSSSRTNGKKNRQGRNQWNKQPYLDLFSYSLADTTGFSFPLKFSKQLNSRLHESTSSITLDGSVIYFTRNNLNKAKIIKDSTDIRRLRIVRATLDTEMKWSKIEDLPFNNDHYSVAHPSLSHDGKKLYFASDMPGGYGMSDIYVVDVFEDGSFGVPENLGPEINTEGRDTFPFISKTEVLYFASDGHLGLGGLDIFAIPLTHEEKKVYNVGKPINSSSDDITFIINDDTRKGFFASNRPGGRGDDDIYSFIENTPLITTCKGSIQGLVVDSTSGNPIPNANVVIKDQNGEVIYKGYSNDQAFFFSEVDCNNVSYDILIEKVDYDTITEKVKIVRENPNWSNTFALKNQVPAKGIDLAKLLSLKPIYFASNKSLILGKTAEELDKIVSYLKKYKSIQIEIGSHTDSRGSDAYNLKLSKRRATSTANYIISKGVDPSRVKSRGYGETVLINACSNGVRCSKEQHAKNRRSEFIVTDN